MIQYVNKIKAIIIRSQCVQGVNIGDTLRSRQINQNIWKCV